MRDRISTTYNIDPIYSYTETDWVKCPNCGKKQFKAIERKGSVIEIQCRSCKKAEKITI